MFYNTNEGALTFYNEESDIGLQIGQEFYIRVYNASNSTINNGTPVYASGAQGDRVKVWTASATPHYEHIATENHIIGLATHDISANSEGYVTELGIVRGINVGTGWAAGDTIYVSSSGGELTNIRPEYPYEKIEVGILVRDSPLGNGFIFVKDSDNYFEVDLKNQDNQICYFDLNDKDGINARNKSYLELDTNNVVFNIVEKKIISSNFSVGGYGFSDAKQFCDAHEKLKDIEGECYISNIIFEMLLSGKTFYGTKTLNYKDWGTIEDWNKYKESYKTLFVDLDGTLVTNTSHQFPPYIGEGKPLQNNIDYLNKIYSIGRVKIVITTSRPKEYYQKTIDELESKKIPFDEVIMGLPHAQRILINDFARSNPYPSCSSLNIPRNTDNLEDYFK